MSTEDVLHDDQSHYEISLTAGQAFLAFVLLLLSLAASFAFGLMIGRGQGDERLVVRKEPAVVTEASVAPKKASGHIVELGVTDDDFKAAAPSKHPDNDAQAPIVSEETTTTAPVVTNPAPTPAQSVVDAQPAPTAAAIAALPAQTPTIVPAHVDNPKPVVHETKPPARIDAPKPAVHETARPNGPVFAQLLSTADQKTAEALAAQVINGGFSSAYVERGTSDKGTVYKVRVKFASDADARAAEPKLHEFSKDVWIVK